MVLQEFNAKDICDIVKREQGDFGETYFYKLEDSKDKTTYLRCLKLNAARSSATVASLILIPNRRLERFTTLDGQMSFNMHFLDRYVERAMGIAPSALSHNTDPQKNRLERACRAATYFMANTKGWMLMGDVKYKDAHGNPMSESIYWTQEGLMICSNHIANGIHLARTFIAWSDCKRLQLHAVDLWYEGKTKEAISMLNQHFNSDYYKAELEKKCTSNLQQ